MFVAVIIAMLLTISCTPLTIIVVRTKRIIQQDNELRDALCGLLPDYTKRKKN